MKHVFYKISQGMFWLVMSLAYCISQFFILLWYFDYHRCIKFRTFVKDVKEWIERDDDVHHY